ncbi:hypothetical protein PS914_00347 [Pseudomonas fluorescens]|uniref:dermonecrotic toxin domain-containing protein n=1 Tax=Pseudomonas fluorescens TaxID=294 RepID=UPI00123F1C46|nr:hypothetical protein PS914_00347 [Pseudomonas fluorescens]
MTDRLLFDSPFPVPAVIPPFSPMSFLPDVSLFLKASARWRESSQSLRELMADSPGIRDTLEQRLKQQLNLDGQHAGLLFAATDQQPQRFVSFTQACAFVLQHPTLETTLDKDCTVTGLNQTHALSSLTPLQMLERLKTLDPIQAHSERWATFWDQRAPGTAVSRKERTLQLYRQHFEAAAHLALARNALTAEQFKPLQLLIDPPVGALTLDNQPVHTEQLALILSNGSRIKPKGAWVISVGDPATVAQLLYLPSRPVAIQRFNTRSDMETWLSRQTLVPTGLPTDNIRYEYTASTDPMGVGASELFADRSQSQVTSLRHRTPGQSGLAAHGAQSLVQADRIDQQRSHLTVFASPPRLEAGDDGTDQASLFGSLYADIPWSLRQAALKKQRDALETLVEEAGEGEGLKTFKDSLKALETAEQAADKAASGLLNRSRVADLVSFQSDFTALHSAHKAGLQAEVALQLALKQLDEDEYTLLKALLDTPDDPGPDPVAASLSLSMTEQESDTPTVTAQELKGAFIVTRADALADADSPHSVLLYWIGTGGGLQRFANRRELERQIFKIHDQNNGLTVRPKKITGDALLYGLDQLTSDFEEQAGAIRQRHVAAAADDQRNEQLDILRKRALATLQVPVHAARNQAFAHLQEQSQSATLASSLPDWLRKLTENERNGLKGLIEAYIPAMKHSHALMTIALEPRDDFTRKHLHARLRKDFAIEGSFEVRIDLPDSVKWEKQFDPAPGQSGYKLALIPSATRSKMPLDELAQLNIDNTPSMNLEPLSLRLSFMRVEVTTADATERQTLTSGITRDYLKRVLPELDLPKAYEQLIRDAFMGATTESVFVREHRRASLIEPWSLMLKLQGEFARLQQHIDHNDLNTLKIAIEATTPQAWKADGKRIVLLPACLNPGGEDTPNEGPVTLSGVTFIEEQISATTLLYLPDSPDGQFLRRYDSLEAARKALFNLCAHDKWVTYLAGRALQGSVRAHESRINQAMLKNFDALIGVGVSWPATTSLAAHLLNAHMGRLIEAHRGTSRSNDALYMERYALKGPRAFNYIKMAMGMLPFIGSAFAFYDAWTSANQAVAAFLRGEVGDGLAEVESMLVSLIDAAMDLLPGEVAFSVFSQAARSLTRTRQLQRLARHVPAMHGLSQRQARHAVARFADYDYEKPISLSSVQPATHGLYRGIYRHADGDFIVRQGRIFQVELSKDSRSWRLFGNSRKTYKQPIALDETGHWDTWYGVYGTTLEGGVLGGGQVLGHVADTFDALWPQAIRQRLPRWWTDRIYRRRQTLTEGIPVKSAQLKRQVIQSNELIALFGSSDQASKRSLIQAVDTATTHDITQAKELFGECAELLESPALTREIRKRLQESKSNSAMLIVDRFSIKTELRQHRIMMFEEHIEDIRLKILSSGEFDEGLRLMNLRQSNFSKILQELEGIETDFQEIDIWLRQVTDDKQLISINSRVKNLDRERRVESLPFEKARPLLDLISHYNDIADVSWTYLHSQMRESRIKLYRALIAQEELTITSVTLSQRNAILNDSLNTYDEFMLNLRIWPAGYPQHFNLKYRQPLLDIVEGMSEKARTTLMESLVRPKKATRKVFETEDGKLLIGKEIASNSGNRRYAIEHASDHVETWEEKSSGKWQVIEDTSPPPPVRAQDNVKSLVSEARNRLAKVQSYVATVEGYARQGMLPVSLDGMMVSEAAELTQRSNRIERLDGQEALIARLREKATELTASGRAMRTSQSLISKNPTDGMLADLIDQKAVEIRKYAPLKNLSKPKKRADYMQEYEVWDLTQTPPKVLWYAHFHYTTATPAFRKFEEAHLKLAEHRFLTRADNPELPEGKIGERSVVLPHFENL